jgi:hypothetical protein
MHKATVVLVMVVGLVGAGENQQPPSIEYGGSRESSTWVETPIGKVAVDKGVEWQGTKVYLSLTFDLVAVDAKTGKTLWSEMVAMFWTRVGFKEVEVAPGKKTWAVELKAVPRDKLGVDTVQYHDLRTGKKLDIPGLVRKPSGRPFKPRAEWSGATCGVAKPFQAVISTNDVWEKVMTRISVGSAFGKISFMRSPEKSNPLGAVENEVVLIVSAGDTWNSRGIVWVESYEDEKRILLRVRHEYYQTLGGGDAVRPWGVFVLPNRQKAYEVEINVQDYIGAPPVWKKIYRAERLLDPAKQLERMPPSDKREKNTVVHP